MISFGYPLNIPYTPRKKTSLGESLAGSQDYNPIRDSRRDSLRDFSRQRVSPRVLMPTSLRSSARDVRWSSRTKRKIGILEFVRLGVRTAPRIRVACNIEKSLFSLTSQSTEQTNRKIAVLNAEFSK